MIEHEAPIILIRGLMLCDNVEINDVIIDVLIQMTSVEVQSFPLRKTRSFG